MFLVLTTGADAAETVLEHERKTGWPDPDIAWQDGRCVRLAWYEKRPMSFFPEPGPPYPVYLVRLVDQIGTAGVTWVMVDARTGEIGSATGAPLKSGCADEACPRATSTNAE